MNGLTPSELPRLSGSDVFRESRRSVLEFWQWAMGDLRMNTARGVLAEYLIAVAVDSTTPFRIEWAGHDVTGADGTRIEAKSAAYLQSWAQKKPSTPRFDWKAANAKIWDPQVGAEVDPPNGRADVWVFALQTCGDHALYDPLDEGQWTFWVAPHWRVARCAQVSGGLVYMRKMAGEPVVWGNLAHAVALARRQNDDLA